MLRIHRHLLTLAALPLILAGALWAAPKPKATQTVVILGSSTAAGVGAAPASECWANRYAAYLSENYPNLRLVNLAVGGYTTYHLLPTGSRATPHRPAPDAARNITAALAMSPAAIIINLGGNDEMDGFADGETVRNYEAIIAAAYLQHVPVWVTTPKPVARPLPQRKHMLSIRDWTIKRFGELAIDFWSGLAAPDGSILPAYSAGDGVHANNAGHAILFERVVSAGIPERIAKLLEEREPEPERRRPSAR